MNPPRFTKSVSFWSVGNVYQDPCDHGKLPDPPIGPTVDDLVAALDAQVNSDMAPAVDIEIGGYPAEGRDDDLGRDGLVRQGLRAGTGFSLTS